jgi:tellurite resistance protein TerC
MSSVTPVSYWIGFHVLVFALMGLELLYVRRQAATKLHATSVAATALWVGTALAFGGFVLATMGRQAATEYIAGYAIEESLSKDNLFVLLLLFKVFRIEPARQPKVLIWGVISAIVLRGTFIATGIELLSHFEWISYVFAAILLFASVKLVLPSKTEEKEPRWLKWLSELRPISLRQDCFFTVENGQRMATVLFLTLVAIEITDVIFAIDSIPAVLSITRHPFLAYTSNIMAVMGLRSMYFLLAHLLERLRFLHYGLAGVLAFAALKMLASEWIEIGPLMSLCVVVILISITVVLSMMMKSSPVANPQVK